MLARIRKSAEEKDQGFTLIELLVVIIIIGILAAIAIPVFLRQREKGWDAAVKSDLRNAATAEETLLTDSGAYTTDVSVLQSNGFKPSADSNYTTDFATSFTVPTADAGSSYCIQGVSASGNTFHYDSANGGLKSGSC
jgi:type IV pilus assembly protein PilA